MSYTDKPRPLPVSTVNYQTLLIIARFHWQEISDCNLWPALIEAVQYHHNSHVSKTLRTLIFAFQNYGDRAPGTAIAFHRNFGTETHNGTRKMDGTIFVRAAGLVLDNLRWVNYGQKEGEWDRSALLGWDAAWDSGD